MATTTASLSVVFVDDDALLIPESVLLLLPDELDLPAAEVMPLLILFRNHSPPPTALRPKENFMMDSLTEEGLEDAFVTVGLYGGGVEDLKKVRGGVDVDEEGGGFGAGGGGGGGDPGGFGGGPEGRERLSEL